MLCPGEGGYLVLGRVDTLSWGGWILGSGEGGYMVLGKVDSWFWKRVDT